MKRLKLIILLLCIVTLIFILFTKLDTYAHKCNAECKVKYLTDDLNIVKELSHEIVYVCAKNTKDPVHCITYLSAVTKSESSWWWNCKNYNCVWMFDWWISFKSYNDMAIDWVTRYNKYWYKANNAEFFYGSWPKNPAKSRYCMSEDSSWAKGWCPNWRATAESVILKIKKQGW